MANYSVKLHDKYDKFVRVNIERDNLTWEFDIYAYWGEPSGRMELVEFDGGGFVVELEDNELDPDSTGHIVVTVPQDFAKEIRKVVSENLPKRG